MGDEQTIALCMIVKNEEKLLGKCLQSAKSLVDEIVVVDTGSTDRTMEIANEFGARVYQHAWQNSFSEARNHALNYVTSDWILQLDADEQLEQGDIPLVRNLIQSKHYHAIFVAIYNYLPRGRTKLYFPRIFRRGKAHYEGIVHNQVAFAGKPLQSEIRIYHYGYNLSPETMAAKYDRSRRLLETQLSENSENIFAWYNLIRLYKNQGRYLLAAEKGEQIIDKFSPEKSPNIYLMIMHDTADAMMKINRFDRAVQICKNALALKADYLDVLYLQGLSYKKMADYARAAMYFAKFIEQANHEKIQPQIHLLDLSTIDFLDMANAHLGECQWQMAQRENAQKSFLRALSEYKARVQGLDSKIKMHHEILSTMANVYVRLNNFNQAAELYQQCLQQIPTHPQWLNNLATCYAKMGKTDLAYLGYQAALVANPYYQDAKRNLHVLGQRTT